MTPTARNNNNFTTTMQSKNLKGIASGRAIPPKTVEPDRKVFSPGIRSFSASRRGVSYLTSVGGVASARYLNRST